MTSRSENLFTSQFHGKGLQKPRDIRMRKPAPATVTVGNRNVLSSGLFAPSHPAERKETSKAKTSVEVSRPDLSFRGAVKSVSLFTEADLKTKALAPSKPMLVPEAPKKQTKFQPCVKTENLFSSNTQADFVSIDME